MTTSLCWSRRLRRICAPPGSPAHDVPEQTTSGYADRLNLRDRSVRLCAVPTPERQQVRDGDDQAADNEPDHEGHERVEQPAGERADALHVMVDVLLRVV